MLTWNDETSTQPATTPVPPGIVPGTQPVRAATGVFGDTALPTPGLTHAPAATAAAVTPDASQQRVNVSEKRIINGKTDVNQLVPFKYKWAGCRKKSICRATLRSGRTRAG